MGGGPPPPPPPPPPFVPGGGPPPPPPPPPGMGGPPPPPPPPGMGGPPPPPPPPGMGGPPPPPPPPGMGPPPPPPPPGGAPSPQAAAPPPEEPMDMFAAIRAGARGRLKKRAPPPEKPLFTEPVRPKLTPAEEKLALEAEKQELFIELLGFMEAPNGNVEELLDKLVKSTKTVRSFIFLLIRRKWLDGVRVLNPGLGKPAKSCIVWQNMEVTTYIELKDVTEKDLKEAFEENVEDEELMMSRGIVARVRMYRFDEASRKHVTDEIALMKTKHFPRQTKKFDLPEPPGKERSLEQRKLWDEWFDQKQTYMQSDFPQFELIFKKLLTADETVVSAANQLEQTLQEMKRMGEAMNDTFTGFTPKQLRNIIKEVPKRVKDIAKNLEHATGMIIKADSLKLTPEFLKKMDLSAESPDGLKKKEEAGKVGVSVPGSVMASAAAAAVVVPTGVVAPAAEGAAGVEGDKGAIPNPKGSITMAGVPVDVLIPLLKKSYSVKEGEGKNGRRLTL
ncbi:hypothetical protein HDU98_011673 [Podochytrium sp. JEL0797]|nr:hypothetical protein HDU98_011673 [Podochytrium sp. JEL0797]